MGTSDVEELHRLWTTGKATEAGKLIYEALSDEQRAAWAANILEFCRQYWPRVRQIEDVLEIARHPNCWQEAKHAFIQVRLLTLKEGETHSGGPKYEALLFVAEVTVQMGVNFTAENAESAEKLKKNRRQAPFAGLYSVQHVSEHHKNPKICSSRRPQRPQRPLR